MEPKAKQLLLEMARNAVVDASMGHQARPPEMDLPEALSHPGAAFVSLHTHAGALRGCVGTTQALRPLAEVVRDMAQAAALRDPRFPPVRPDELPNLDVEISILHPLEPIVSLRQVEIGMHGLVVKGRGRYGLLLPQVAVDRNWDVETFAEQTCQKAGLPMSAYLDDDILLYRFRSEILAEEA